MWYLYYVIILQVQLMKISNWSSLIKWILSVGPKSASTSQQYITSLQSRDRDAWRKRVSKFSPKCTFAGVISDAMHEKRGGLVIGIETKCEGKINLLIPKNKCNEMDLAKSILSNASIVSITFTPYIHFEYGLIGLVESISSLCHNIENQISIKPKQLPKNATSTNTTITHSVPRSTNVWNSSSDEQLMNYLSQDIGLRQIALQMNVTPKFITNRMLQLSIIDIDQFAEIKRQLLDLGCFQ